MEKNWFNIRNIEGQGNIRESRFRSKDFTVKCDEIKRAWPVWSTEDRAEFMSAYAVKPDISDEDVCILDFLMENANEYVASIMAGSLTRHPDRAKVVVFLSVSLQSEAGSKANQLFVLGMLGDSVATPEIENLVQRISSYPVRDMWANQDYVYACWALTKLGGKPPETIESLAASPDPTLAEPARTLLSGNAVVWWLRSNKA
jgi:hypothetical protein